MGQPVISEMTSEKGNSKSHPEDKKEKGDWWSEPIGTDWFDEPLNPDWGELDLSGAWIEFEW